MVYITGWIIAKVVIWLPASSMNERRSYWYCLIQLRSILTIECWSNKCRDCPAYDDSREEVMTVNIEIGAPG